MLNERMISVASEEPEPEGVKQDQRHPLTGVDATPHLIWDIGESPQHLYGFREHAPRGQNLPGVCERTPDTAALAQAPTIKGFAWRPVGQAIPRSLSH